jgi:cytochrome P450
MHLLRRARRPPDAGFDLSALNAEPVGLLRQLRAAGPVVAMPGGRPWFVTRWDEVRQVLVDDDAFLSRIDPLPRGLAATLPFADGEQHERCRAVVQARMTPRPAAGFAEAVVPAVADGLLDTLAETDGGDLMLDYAEPLAGLTVRALLGLESMSLPDLLAWRDDVSALFLSALTGSTGQGAVRRPVPDVREDSFVTAILGGLEEDGALGTLDTLVLAGVDGLRDAVAQTLFGLLSHPAQLELVRGEPDRLKNAIEEGARWWSPVHTVLRRPVADVVLGGVAVPAGTMLAVSLGSANRDERRWNDPDRFDVERDEGTHLAFSSGRHYCLGAWLVRRAGAIAVGRALERLAGLRLDPSRPPATGGWAFHRVHSLPARWD